MVTNPVLEELLDESRTDGISDGAADNNFKEEFEKLVSLDEEWRDYMAQAVSYSSEASGRSQEARDKRQFFFDFDFPSRLLFNKI